MRGHERESDHKRGEKWQRITQENKSHEGICCIPARVLEQRSEEEEKAQGKNWVSAVTASAANKSPFSVIHSHWTTRPKSLADHQWSALPVRLSDHSVDCVLYTLSLSPSLPPLLQYFADAIVTLLLPPVNWSDYRHVEPSWGNLYSALSEGVRGSTTSATPTVNLLKSTYASGKWRMAVRKWNQWNIHQWQGSNTRRNTLIAWSLLTQMSHLMHCRGTRYTRLTVLAFYEIRGQIDRWPGGLTEEWSSSEPPSDQFDDERTTEPIRPWHPRAHPHLAPHHHQAASCYYSYNWRE